MATKTHTQPEAPATTAVESLPEAPATKARRTHRAPAATKPEVEVINHDDGTTADEVKATSKLKWTLAGERDEKGRVEQHAVAPDGTTYAITGSGAEWKASVTGDGKTTVLGDKVSHGKAYHLCVGHAKGAKTAAA